MLGTLEAMLRRGFSPATATSVPLMPFDRPKDSTGDVQGAVIGALIGASRPTTLATPNPPAPESASTVSKPSEPASSHGNQQPGQRRGTAYRAFEWGLVLLGAFVLAVLIRQYMFQAFWIESESMESTLEVRDRVLVNRLSYSFGDVSRGDVVVFARLPDEPGETRDLIKRVIGLPGDSVEGRSNTIYVNGSRLVEPYIDAESYFFGDFGPVLVPDHELFVMGDNRNESLDSRRFGTIDIDRAAGRAFIRFWPLDRIGSL